MAETSNSSSSQPVVGSSVNRVEKRVLNETNTNKVKRQTIETEKAKRITLTKAQKAELCHLRKSGYTQLSLANHFKIGESTVSKILKQEDHWLSIDPNSTQAKSKRDRSAKYPQLEEVLSLWISKAEAYHQTITGAIIQRKAFQFAERLQISNFGGSEGWLANFKKRFHIKEYTRQGEAASTPLNELPQYRDELKDIIKNYDPRDVYNCDETGLYWRLEPEKTLASGPVHGKKKAKDRATILITCNSTGDDKLPLLFIYKYQNPRAIRRIDKAKLPVYYYWNSSSWMQLSIFNHYIRKLNEQMKRAGRKILLLMDQASPHTLEEGFVPSNIKIHHLPANTTTHLQPCDAGIIWSFKAHYRKLFCENRIAAYEEAIETGEDTSIFNIKDAIDLSAEAWKKVTNSTIRNCWIKTGILPDNYFSLNDSLPTTQELIEDFELVDLTLPRSQELEGINHTDLVTEIQSLISQLPVTNPMQAENFIEADHSVETDIMPSDDEIITAVLDRDCNEDDENEPEVRISYKEVITSINNILHFIDQEDGFKVDGSFVQKLNSFKKDVVRDSIAKKRQTTMDLYMQN